MQDERAEDAEDGSELAHQGEVPLNACGTDHLQIVDDQGLELASVCKVADQAEDDGEECVE